VNRTDRPSGSRENNSDADDVIADTEVIDACVGDLSERPTQPLRIAAGHLQRVSEEPDTDTGAR